MALFKRRRGTASKQKPRGLKGRVVKSRSTKEGAKPYAVESRYWWGEYKDGQGRTVRVKLAPDRREAERLLASYEAEATRERLGLVNRFAKPEGRPLTEHLTDYAAYLEDDGNSRDYVDKTQSRIERVLQGCGWSRIGDITAEAVKGYLADLGKQGLGPTTLNHYLRAVKSFAMWLVRTGKTGENRLAYLSALNPRTDIRHERRALTDEEARSLVQVAARGPVRFDMTGPHRALVYRVALATGLRRNELRSLTWASFDLDGPEPTVTVEAAYSKHRRRDVLPLAGHIAQALREWRREHPGEGAVLPLPQGTAKMLKADLKAAGIEYKRGGRVADFHSLRHTFISNLIRDGVHVKVAQGLARHQTVTLTLDRYTRPEVLDHRSAVDALPDLSENVREKQAREAVG